MATAGLGQLGLWLHLRSRAGHATARPATLPPVPPGTGPALVLHVSPDAPNAERQVLRRLLALRPDLRVIRLAAPADAGGGTGADLADDPGHDPGNDPGDDPVLMRQLLDSARPRALLLIGSALPVALIAAAEERGLPVVLAEARLEAAQARSTRSWGLNALLRRQLLQSMAAVLAADSASETAALRMGVARERLDMTGPVTQIREPLECSEAERTAMAHLMEGRHTWFAAALPPAEEEAVLAAHEAVLRHSHRALLIVAPSDATRADALAAKAEAMGLSVARRAAEEDPQPDIQVLLTDGLTEMGLWYRLAPVSFMGGTLSGDDSAARHPFEPAALGSAIVHGPMTGRHATEWQQLDRAGAARAVTGEAALAQVMTELTSPEMIATLASNAWSVSTGGADVAIRIADRVFEALAQAVAGNPA